MKGNLQHAEDYNILAAMVVTYIQIESFDKGCLKKLPLVHMKVHTHI